MRRIAFVRHGEIQENEDLARSGERQGCDLADLTKLGEKQCHALAERLANFGAKAIFSSPYLRAKRSAAIIASHLKVLVVEHAGLSEIGPREPLDAMAFRVHTALSDILSRDDDNIIIVSHGSPIQEMVGSFGLDGNCGRGGMIIVEVKQ